MPDGAILLDRAYFDSIEWREQQRDGFSTAAAWLDLLAIVNQKAATIHVRGMAVDLQRGQSGFSKKGLSDRWGWSQGKVSRVLMGWKKSGRINEESNNETTIITVLNYDDYQTGLRTLCEQTESRRRADGEQTGTEKGEGIGITEGPKGRREKGEGIGNVPDRLITFEMALNYIRSNGDMIYTEDQIKAEWLYFDSRRGPNGEWLTERGQVWSDWRSALTLGLMRTVKKNTPDSNGTGLSANVVAIQSRTRTRDLDFQVRALENEIHQERLSNLPVDSQKKSRLKTLRAELAQMETVIP